MTKEELLLAIEKGLTKKYTEQDINNGIAKLKRLVASQPDKPEAVTAKPTSKAPKTPVRSAPSNTPKNADPKSQTTKEPIIPAKKVVPVDRTRTFKPKPDPLAGKDGKNKFLKDLTDWLHKN